MQNKNKKGRGRKNDKSTWSSFPSTPWKNLSVKQILDSAVKGKN